MLGNEHHIIPAADGDEAVARAPGAGDVLSAKADEELRVKLLSESAQDYVVKPFSADELRARVRNQVALKHMRDLLKMELDSQSTDVAELSRQLYESRAAPERSLEERESVKASLAELRNGYHQRVPLGATLSRCDGSCSWAHVSISVVPGSDLAPRMLVGVFDDSTARKQAEDEQKNVVSLVENSTDFIGIASPEGQVGFVNQAGRRIVGLDPEQHPKRLTIYDFMAKSERDKLRDDILPQLWRKGHWKSEALLRNFRTGKTWFRCGTTSSSSPAQTARRLL